jgi:hypothetical protein
MNDLRKYEDISIDCFLNDLLWFYLLYFSFSPYFFPSSTSPSLYLSLSLPFIAFALHFHLPRRVFNASALPPDTC